MKPLFIKALGMIEEGTANGIKELNALIEKNPELCQLTDEDSDSPSLLHHAIYCQNAMAVHLLLEKGSDLEANDPDSGSTPLLLALEEYSAEKGKEIVLALLAKGASVIPKDQQENTALHLAAVIGDLEVGQLLLSKGAEVNAQNREGETALHCTTYNKRARPFAEMLCKVPNIHLDTKNILNQSAFYTAVLNQNTPIVAFLMEQGFDPFNDTDDKTIAIRSALENCHNTELFKVLFSKSPHLEELYRFILANDLEGVKIKLADPASGLTADHFNIFMLLCVNTFRFEIADLIVAKLETHPSKQPFKSILNNPNDEKKKQANAKKCLKQKYKFPVEITLERQKALKDAFHQVMYLLLSPQSCLELLKELDLEIAKHQRQIGCDFSQIKPGTGFVVDHLIWPSRLDDKTVLIKDSFKLLRTLLREKLKQHQIETEEKLYTFAGFVDPKEANKFVKKGRLFKEQFLLGNSLYHGLYSHYLQWYIFARAFETKRFHFKDNLTLLDLMQAFVTVKMKGQYLWPQLIDYTTLLGEIALEYNFGSPHQLNSALLSTETLPHLRGYLLNSWYKNIQKFQDFVCHLAHKRLSYESLITAQVLSGEFFGLFNIGLTQKDIARYYETHSKTKEPLLKKTNIIVKNTKITFFTAHAEQDEEGMEPPAKKNPTHS